MFGGKCIGKWKMVVNNERIKTRAKVSRKGVMIDFIFSSFFSFHNPAPPQVPIHIQPIRRISQLPLQTNSKPNLDKTNHNGQRQRQPCHPQPERPSLSPRRLPTINRPRRPLRRPHPLLPPLRQPHNLDLLLPSTNPIKLLRRLNLRRR